jgi:hypothetical protein
MIVSSAQAPWRVGAGGSATAEWSTLARRGMLFSECEAVELLRMPPDGHFEMPTADGVERVWLVIDGGGHASTGESAIAIGGSDLLVWPCDRRISFTPGSRGLVLLVIATTPAAVSESLPSRAPVAANAEPENDR